MLLRLYRSDSACPPFHPVCSWSHAHEVAEARRAQRVFKHGYGTIWVADVDVKESSSWMPGPIRKSFGNGSAVKLREPVYVTRYTKGLRTWASNVFGGLPSPRRPSRVRSSYTSLDHPSRHAERSSADWSHQAQCCANTCVTTHS